MNEEDIILDFKQREQEILKEFRECECKDTKIAKKAFAYKDSYYVVTYDIKQDRCTEIVYDVSYPGLHLPSVEIINL